MSTNAYAAQTKMYNLRCLLIFLVVTINMLEPITKNHEMIGGIYTLVFTFHMPLFVLVTGYFAGKQPLKNILPTIAYQYTIFQSIYCILDLLFFQMQDDVYSYFVPYAFLWFLFSHMGWRTMLHFVTKLKHPFTASIAIGLLSGMLPFDSMWLSLSQMLFFFPFYVLGHKISSSPQSFLEWYKYKFLKWTAIVVFVAGFAAVTLSYSFAGVPALTGAFYYHEAHISLIEGICIRSVIYLLELLMSAAFLTLISNKSSRITDAGKRTLYVYLLHALIVRTLIRFNITDWFAEAVRWLLIPLIAAFIVAVLSSKKAYTIFHYLLEPPFLEEACIKKWTIKLRAHP